MPRGVYQRRPSRARERIVRSLKPGEPRPEGTPRRYPDRAGYIRLRWKVGVQEYVEAREHRDLVSTDEALVVHHKDHNPANNDPSNLVEMTAKEHAALHAEERWSFDRSAAAVLYAKGWSTTAIGQHYGVHASSVSRGLRSIGVTMRMPGRHSPRVA